MTRYNRFSEADAVAARARRSSEIRISLKKWLAPWTSYVVFSSIAVMTVASAVTALAADLPEGIEAGKARVVAQARGEGLQIYECTADAAGHLAWKFREPLATLISNGKTIGRHFAGPGWEFTDGSRITGKVASQAPSNAGDIPLLRLDVVEHAGTGDLSAVDTVQRLNTKGGVFSGACDKAGVFHLEPYSADYIFLAH